MSYAVSPEISWFVEDVHKISVAGEEIWKHIRIPSFCGRTNVSKAGALVKSDIVSCQQVIRYEYMYIHTTLSTSLR